MACYNPMKIYVDEDKEFKYNKKKVRFLGQIDYKSDISGIKSGFYKLVPCGKCIGCKLDYARSWSDRLVLELDGMKKAVFITFTYDNENLPREVNPNTGELMDRIVHVNDSCAPVAPLVKFHITEFMKNIRAFFQYKERLNKILIERPEMITYENDKPIVKLRFFAAGEYGETRHRPHYHMILFGLSLEDLAYLGKCIPFESNELGQVTFRSEALESIWKKGIVGVSEANYLTMGYTARYTVKKAYGNDYPKKYGLPEEFTIMSRNPGIGANFLKDHKDIVKEVNTWYDHGKEIFWPSYVLDKYYERTQYIESWDPFDGSQIDRVLFRYFDPAYREIKEARQQLSLDNFVQKFDNDERSYEQKQSFLQEQKHNAVKKLKRGDVTLS